MTDSCDAHVLRVVAFPLVVCRVHSCDVRECSQLRVASAGCVLQDESAVRSTGLAVLSPLCILVAVSFRSSHFCSLMSDLVALMLSGR